MWWFRQVTGIRPDIIRGKPFTLASQIADYFQGMINPSRINFLTSRQDTLLTRYLSQITFKQAPLNHHASTHEAAPLGANCSRIPSFFTTLVNCGYDTPKASAARNCVECIRATRLTSANWM